MPTDQAISNSTASFGKEEIMGSFGNNALLSDDTHSHVFSHEHHHDNEHKVWIVIAVSAMMMVIEIIGGTIYGSMALVADGWHMSTHAGAMLITVLAYYYARRHAHNQRFTFGTGKFGDLAGFASAGILALIALQIGIESLFRLNNPVEISFRQAIMVAVIGLVVNLVSALLLRENHAHAHGDHHHERDHNLYAAYLHVIADALTSILAIVALSVGWIFDWLWADPAMGLVSALVIARWSWGLIRDTGAILLDASTRNGVFAQKIRAALKLEKITVTDLHVWQVGPDHYAVIIALKAVSAQPPQYYKERLKNIHGLSHLTIEVNTQDDQT